MHNLQKLASVGTLFEFPPYFLDVMGEIVVRRSSRRCNVERKMLAADWAHGFAVRRALECEIRVLGKHVNFRVGLDFERGLDYEK